jgi:hypothetical protein
MTVHRGTRIRSILLAGLISWLPWTAFAQLQAPNRRDVVERVADRCPGLIQQDHAFTDAVATLLNAEDGRWGRNGKRGNVNDPSHDAVAFRNPASPFGVSVVDIIGSAGSPSASPAWIDQTQATIDARTTGVWVAPSGRLPACLTGAVPPPGPGPGPVDPPPVTPPPVDLGSVHEQLAAIRNELTSLRESRITRTDMEGQTGILYRLIAEQLIAVHIGELVERIDKLQADVAAVKTRVERARILGY